MKAELEMRVGVGAGLIAALVSGFVKVGGVYARAAKPSTTCWLGGYCQGNSIECNETVLAAYFTHLHSVSFYHRHRFPAEIISHCVSSTSTVVFSTFGAVDQDGDVLDILVQSVRPVLQKWLLFGPGIGDLDHHKVFDNWDFMQV